jgi:hypothetical protein
VTRLKNKRRICYSPINIKKRRILEKTMKTKDENIQTIIDILQNKMGIRSIKQILCVLLLIFEADEKKIMNKLGLSYNTIKKYSSMLKEGKLVELFIDNNKHRIKSDLENYTEVILAELDKIQ